MLKMILFFVIAAAIETVQMIAAGSPKAEEKADADAVVVTAYRDKPFPDVYDEKAGRSVSSYKYVWEYQGKSTPSPSATITGTSGSRTSANSRGVRISYRKSKSQSTGIPENTTSRGTSEQEKEVTF